jgi:hypothetical protein
MEAATLLSALSAFPSCSTTGSTEEVCRAESEFRSTSFQLHHFENYLNNSLETVQSFLATPQIELPSAYLRIDYDS